MSLLISTKTELIKTKRSAAFWLSLLGAGVVPLVFFLIYMLKADSMAEQLKANPWQQHLNKGWQMFDGFLLPMFVILICSLVLQIEYKNNTWKQVFASPQTTGQIFFSKYIAILLMILFLFLMYNIFMLLTGVIPNLFFSKYTFLHSPLDWAGLLKANFRTFISLLAIISIQYWFSLRFRNFIVPIGLGLALLITAMILIPWEHIDKVPYAFPMLSFMKGPSGSGSLLDKHEIISICYFVVFTALAFADLRWRKERG